MASGREERALMTESIDLKHGVAGKAHSEKLRLVGMIVSGGYDLPLQPLLGDTAVGHWKRRGANFCTWPTHVGDRFLSGGQPPGHEVICASASAKRIKSGRRRHLQLWRARPTISPVASDDVTRAGHLRTGRCPDFGVLEAQRPKFLFLHLADACASAKRIKSGRRRHLQLWRARPTFSPVPSDDVTRAGHLRTGQSYSQKGQGSNFDPVPSFATPRQLLNYQPHATTSLDWIFVCEAMTKSQNSAIPSHMYQKPSSLRRYVCLSGLRMSNTWYVAREVFN
ncbi:hypothetical protein Bbelb_355010 [Branchiostoma belcheri]|nr:hypothetical protein Bbelb_355010 [Branchiostoma belcheri]